MAILSTNETYRRWWRRPRPTLRRRMLLSLACSVLGSLALAIGSLVAIDGLHQDMTASIQGYRQLRQLFDVGFLVSRAREAIGTTPPQPQLAIAALHAAMAKLEERSDPSATDGPPPRWIDEQSRSDCRALMSQAVDQLTGGAEGIAALNLTFARLSKVAGEVRQSLAESQQLADRRQHLSRIIILWLSFVVIAFSVWIGIWQYRRVIHPIGELSNAVRDFAAGRMDRRVHTQADLEFLSLANDFNKMADELAALYRDLESRVAAKSRQLVRSEQLASLGFLAAGVAHEINNPLGIIAGYGERAIQQMDSESVAAINHARRALVVICEEAFRCKEITQRLLTLAAPGSLQKAETSLAKIAEMVVATLTGLWTKDRQKLNLKIQLDADLMVFANEGEMKQLVLNLLINAMEAVDPMTGEIEVRVGRDRDRVELSIKDNGRGISSQSLDQIFQPFFSQKLDPANGTGLGLSIAQMIANEHGGEIRAHSDGPQTGSTFTLTLPAAKKAEVLLAAV